MKSSRLPKGRSPVSSSTHADAAPVGQDKVGAEPIKRFFVQHPMQAAAMHAEFRNGITGEAAARLAVDQLAKNG
jgi:hypothetical protein